MANVLFSSVTDVLVKYFAPQIASQMNRATVLAQLIPVEPSRGQNIQWVPRFGTTVGSTIADGADVSTFNSDTKLAATLQYGIYNDAFAISGLAASAAMQSGNPEELADLFGEELMEAVWRLAKKISADLWAGTGAAPQIAGLTGGAAITDTGTYAGITRASQAQWAATVAANGGVPRALTLSLMRDVIRLVYVASGMKPDLIVLDPFQYQKYGMLMDPQRHYTQEVRLRGQSILLDGGFQVLEFDGIPVVMDADAPAGKIFFLNTRQMSLKYLPTMSSLTAGKASEVPLVGQPEYQYGFGSSFLSAKLHELSRGGDLYKFQLICYPQLKVTRPNAHGTLADLAVT